MTRVVAVLPALNEAAALPVALDGAPAWLETIVVDNRSTDATAEVARGLGARVVAEPFRGYGAAVQRGLQAAVGADIVVVLDADGTFDWDDLGPLLAPLRAGTADIVLARRAARHRERGAMPWHVAVANAVLGRICGRAAGTRLHDVAPFRAMRGDVIDVIGATDRTYGWPLEFVLRAGRAGLRIREVEVGYRVRAGVSKVTGRPWPTVKAGTRMLWVLARHVTDRQPRPARPVSR